MNPPMSQVPRRPKTWQKKVERPFVSSSPRPEKASTTEQGGEAPFKD